jgi:hypothetical protein
MANQELYKQAIADAKQLKDISMAQAKLAIAEAFNPKIQEMFRLKLSELEEGDLEEAKHEEETMDETYEMEEGSEDNMKEAEESEMNEMSLEEILAELEEDESENPMKEAEENEEEGEEEGEEAAEEIEEPAEEAGEEVAELSVEEFKDLIRDVIADVMSSQSAEGNLDQDDNMGMDDSEEDVIGLDEILAELESEEELDEAKDHSKEKKEKKEMEEMKKELHEAVSTINSLKSSLNEINLLNAKLIYVNKIFKSKTLTESQKIKVVNAFDRANTTKEARNIYETLIDSLGETKRQQIKESVGFASKSIGNSPAKPIVEADSYVNRMQILAGIKKPY